MIENFLEKNWRTVILIGVILLAWFGWPTPYYYYQDKAVLYRQSRLTRQETEMYWYELGQWRPNNTASWAQAKKEAEESHIATGTQK